MSASERLPQRFDEVYDLFSDVLFGGFFRFARSMDLSPPQLGILMRLGHGRPLGVSGVGGELSVTSAAASQMIDKLVQLGLVARSEDEEDRRSKRIGLTAAGADTVDRFKASRREWAKGLAARMSEAEAEILLSAIDILLSKAGCPAAEGSAER